MRTHLLTAFLSAILAVGGLLLLTSIQGCNLLSSEQEEQLIGMNQNIWQLTQSADKLGGEISKLRTALQGDSDSSVKEEIDRLQDRVDGLKQEITKFAGNTKDLEKQLQELTDLLKELKKNFLGSGQG